jgi:sigma-E factor negative regulatory protein RseC
VIEEQARVVSVDNNGLAEVAIVRQPACGSCAAKSGCGTSLLASIFPQRSLRLQLANSIGARPGDLVVVGLDEGHLQRGSLLLYAVPLAGLLVGAVAGENLLLRLGGSGELGGVVGGLLGVIIALGFVRERSRMGRQGGDPGVRLLRLAHHPSQSPVSAVLPDPAPRTNAGLRE